MTVDNFIDKYAVITYAKSGGAGGQNVNKRETAVRISMSDYYVRMLMWALHKHYEK